jgi:DNA mismatch endonuclease, patch repair protein
LDEPEQRARLLPVLEPQANANPQKVPPSPPAVSAGRSRNMAAIKRTNTKPEKRVRQVLHRRGYRFRKDLRIELQTGLRARPDIVFSRWKVAIFIDGCFWHGCPDHGGRPLLNQSYWAPKLAANAARDAAQTEALRASGWRVLRIWEHVETEQAADLVAVALADARADLG